VRRQRPVTQETAAHDTYEPGVDDASEPAPFDPERFEPASYDPMPAERFEPVPAERFDPAVHDPYDELPTLPPGALPPARPTRALRPVRPARSVRDRRAASPAQRRPAQPRPLPESVLPMPTVEPLPVEPPVALLAALPPPAPRGEPTAGSAAELTHDTIMRQETVRPTLGWRGWLVSASAGLVNPGLGPIEQAQNDLLRRIRRPLQGPHRVAIASIKGGVGKTTVAACLGLMLADHRGDRVVALDANPDAGTLADRLTGDSSHTVRHLLAATDSMGSLTDVSRFTSLAGRLQVLASAQDPAVSESFDRAEYEQVCGVLTRFFNIVITDSGTGLVHSAMQGTLELADSLVIVGALSVDGAAGAAKTLDWLLARGYSELVADAVVVLSHDRGGEDVDADLVRAHFLARCRALVEIPADRHLAAGGRIQLAALSRDANQAYLELAANVADSFGAVTSAVASTVTSAGSADGGEAD
jgi:MinD-like ATPase involved in chromosome partitioning or flagellar assembly